MIDYISIEHQNDKDYAIGYKFPFNSCEILSSDNIIILKKFFESNSETNTEKKSEESTMNNLSDNEEKKNENSIEPNEEIKEKKSPIKMINEIETVNSIEENNNRLPLIDYFLDFLEKGSITNSVLCGYFQKIFYRILNFRSADV